MRDYQGEEILVIPRELFDKLGSFQGIETDTARYLEAILDPANNFFMDRAKAEEDPSFKQIIPYAIFHHEGKYLHYTRGKSGGESRLHAQDRWALVVISILSTSVLTHWAEKLISQE